MKKGKIFTFFCATLLAVLARRSTKRKLTRKHCIAELRAACFKFRRQ